jgi:hypothetical protein
MDDAGRRAVDSGAQLATTDAVQTSEVTSDFGRLRRSDCTV